MNRAKRILKRQIAREKSDLQIVKKNEVCRLRFQFKLTLGHGKISQGFV